ncbi:MAG: hypothetical protein QNJ38_03745 [Prochloraceae cyanobacterium]|nr:hypothetical protein [Prochloraceae cyanobacterium]
MGRYINCQIGDEYEIVWKYGFGVQNSEMHRINTELGIGQYHLIRYLEDENEDDEYEYLSEAETDVDGDILILSKGDVQKLEEQLELLKNSDRGDRDKWFIAMLEAIINFIREHSEQDTFIFEGEF